ncbi:transposase [Candidatus Parvarchaeota archaeon]|nr:transposase [Candidatus Parvarchaeota archaeon]
MQIADINIASISGTCDISAILQRIELGPTISQRRTYSIDSMLKAIAFMRIKKIKSYRKLRVQLLSNLEDKRNLGFDDKIPTHQDFSNFICRLTSNQKDTIELVVNKVSRLLDRYPIVLDGEKRVVARKEGVSSKTKFNIRKEKLEEVVNLARKDMDRLFKLNAKRWNRKYANNEILNILISIATSHKFTEGGSFKYRYEHKSGPSAKTILRALNRRSYDDLKPLFLAEMKRQILLAKRKGIIDGRKVTVAVDATDLYFYGDRNSTPNIVNADHQDHGTGFAFKFVEIAIVTHNQRFALCAIPKLNNGEMHDILIDLLKFVKEQVNVGTVLMDRGFYSIEDMRAVDQLGIKFIMPMKSGTNAFKRLSNQQSEVTIVSNILDKFTGIAARKASGELIYTITNIKMTVKDYNLAKYVAFFYRHRWQIESNFREIKQNFLGRTTSVRYVVKYFYFMFANVLFNFWILVNVLLELLYGFKGKDGIATYFFASVLNNWGSP